MNSGADVRFRCSGNSAKAPLFPARNPLHIPLALVSVVTGLLSGEERRARLSSTAHQG